MLAHMKQIKRVCLQINNGIHRKVVEASLYKASQDHNNPLDTILLSKIHLSSRRGAVDNSWPDFVEWKTQNRDDGIPSSGHEARGLGSIHRTEAVREGLAETRVG